MKFRFMKLNKLFVIIRTSNRQMYFYYQTQVQLHVTQKKPIVRVFNLSDESFYIDASANIFPLSKNFTERVLIANGNIVDSSDVSVISKVANYINDDEFLKAQIIQLHMNEDKEIELVPRVGNHTILLGEISEMEDKFNKLKLFYTKGVKQTGWNQYRLINLKYKNQLRKIVTMEEKIAVGLDIGTTKITVMIGRKTEHGKIEILGMGKAPSAGVREGANIEKQHILYSML